MGIMTPIGDYTLPPGWSIAKLREIDEIPDPVPPACVRWLCMRYANRLARIVGDTGSCRPGLGQSAAARALHVDGRTMRRWIAGESPMPWAAAELLRRMGQG
jgi:hypothetical protein